MTIALESMAMAMPEVVGHPNRVDFRGVLTTVDVPSQRAPSGSGGHLVVLTRKAAEAALPSLLGMGLDYAPSLDRHDVRRKIGVITRAEVVGRDLELGGHLFAKDFPDIVAEIAKSGGGHASYQSRGPLMARPRPVAGRALGVHSEGPANDGGRGNWTSSLVAALGRILSVTTTMAEPPQNGGGARDIHSAQSGSSFAGGLGMSYEVTDVQLADPRARVWLLTKVTFTGAAILRRNKAAYPNTWIELGS